MTVLERQYKKFKYFYIDLTAKLAEKNKSAQSHNIDAEKIMGMFSALEKKSRNGTICFQSAKMRAIKKRSVDEYWDTMEAAKQKTVITCAITIGRKARNENPKAITHPQGNIKAYCCRKEKKQSQERKQLERWLKTAEFIEITERFNIETTEQVNLAGSLN